MEQETMTYAGTGVDYDAMDPFKRKAQQAGIETVGNIFRLGLDELEVSRGESVYLVETPDSFLAHVEEGLGTKNLVADAMYRLTGRTYYDHIAQCAVAMIVNDMITLGALPVSVAMHLAVGESEWFNNKHRYWDLVEGWKNACNLADCVWGGGETPTLKGIVMPGTAVLSGSAMGIVKPKKRLIHPANIGHDDVIIILPSSGIHANGLTLARKIADKLPEGYLTKLSDGRTYGATLLEPTFIYVRAIEKCLDHGVNIHYAVNITGHGWRKLMRATQPFAYVIEDLPPPLPIFDFIQKHGPVDDVEAFGNLNMGAGFAVFVPMSDLEEALLSIRLSGSNYVYVAGHIEKSDEKKVVIKPKNLTFLGSTLAIRR
ncbi:MAG: AIR synthase related protein [Patescibacteria group bacterium]